MRLLDQYAFTFAQRFFRSREAISLSLDSFSKSGSIAALCRHSSQTRRRCGLINFIE